MCKGAIILCMVGVIDLGAAVPNIYGGRDLHHDMSPLKIFIMFGQYLLSGFMGDK